MNSIVSAGLTTYIINCLCRGPNCHIIIKKDEDSTIISYKMFFSHSTYNKPTIFQYFSRLFSWFTLGKEIEFEHDNMTFVKEEIDILKEFDPNIKIEKYFDDGETYWIVFNHKIKKKELDYGHFLTYFFHGCMTLTLVKYVNKEEVCYYVE